MPGQAGHDGYPVLEPDRRIRNYPENVFVSYSSQKRNQGEFASANHEYPASDSRRIVKPGMTFVRNLLALSNHGIPSALEFIVIPAEAGIQVPDSCRLLVCLLDHKALDCSGNRHGLFTPSRL
jgi:hypothetical protein